MDKKKIEWLKNLFAHGHKRLVVMSIMSEVEDEKYVSKDYVRQFIDDIDQTLLYGLSELGYLDKYSLMKHRHRQATHDQKMIRKHLDILVKRGVITGPQSKTYLVTPGIPWIKKHTPSEVKKEMGWIEDIEAYGRKQYNEFVKDNVTGPISLDINFTQSVFRINAKGRQRLAEMLEHLQACKT